MNRTPRVASRAAQMVALLTDAAAQAQASGREDLVHRLTALSERVNDPTMRVIVVGQFKQGKSALVNALVDASVCPVDDVVGTAVPTVVSFGETVSATLFTEVDGVDEVQTKPIDVRNLREYVTDVAVKQDGLRPIRVEVTLRSSVLSDGLVLIDTPGIGGTQSAHTAGTLTMLPTADAVLMLSDASQEYTEPELGFLKQAMTLCPTVVCVLSKIDPYPHWRSIAEADRRHLDSADLNLPLLSVSAALHQQAMVSGNAEHDAESGVPALSEWLRTDVVERVTDQNAAAVSRQVISVVDHLLLSVESELQTLRNPQGGGEIVRSLRGAQAAAKALGERTARWQQTLNDGSTDLSNDIDFDLRDRLRTVGREAELLIDDCDPGDSWEEIGAWLADSIAQAVADNFVWAHQRTEWLLTKVGDHFAVDGQVELPSIQLSDTEGVLNQIAGLDRIDSGAMSFGQKVLVGMRSSYGGILMFGLITSLAGLALVNPISIAAGAVIGGFAYRQDASQRLERRRQIAKTATRRLIDEATFQVTKEARDRLNQAKRVLRDHFVELATNMNRSLNEAIEAAKEATKNGGADDILRRINELETHEVKLRDLAARARALADEARADEMASTT